MERMERIALLKFKALTLQTNLKVELDWLKKKLSDTPINEKKKLILKERK